MNRETFPQLLRHPERLSILNFEELRSLVDRYPYAQNLRFLLAKKAQQEQHPEFERLLHLAATYSIDREHLRRQLEMDVTAVSSTNGSSETPHALPTTTAAADALDLNETPGRAATDELTLDELEQPTAERIIVAPTGLTLEELMGKTEPVTNAEPPTSPRSAATPDADELDLSDLEAATGMPPVLVTEASLEPTEAVETELAELVQVEPATVVLLDPEAEAAPEGKEVAPDISSALTPMEEDEDEPEIPESSVALFAKEGSPVEPPAAAPAPEVESVPEPEPEPLPKTAFADYRRDFLQESGTLSILQLMENPDATVPDPTKAKKKKARKKAKKAKREGAKRAARTSLLDSEELVSETLAQLLERQGHNEKAAAMYERLMVLHPEKSSFFAAKIETLRR